MKSPLTVKAGGLFVLDMLVPAPCPYRPGAGRMVNRISLNAAQLTKRH